MKKLPALGAIITDTLRDKKITQEMCAQRLNITHNAIRQDLSTNSFHEEHLAVLCQMVDIHYESLEKLKLRYLFRLKKNPRAKKHFYIGASKDLHGLHTSFNSSVVRLFTNSPNNLKESILTLLQVSGEGDILVFFLGEKTLAQDFFNEINMVKPVFDALTKGLCIAFVQPVLYDIGEELLDMRLKYHVQAGQSDEKILSQIRRFMHTDQRICMPGSFYVLVLRSKEKHKIKDWAWSLGLVPLPSMLSCMVPMSEQVTDTLFAAFEFNMLRSKSTEDSPSEKFTLAVNKILLED
jgi:predicted transcriptional regulator